MGWLDFLSKQKSDLPKNDSVSNSENISRTPIDDSSRSIPESVSINLPNDASRTTSDDVSRTYTFGGDRQTFLIDQKFSHGEMNDLSKLEFSFKGVKSVEEITPKQWSNMYQDLTSNPDDVAIVQRLLRELKSSAPVKTEAGIVQHIVSFVQEGISYDNDERKAILERHASQSILPSVTLYRGKGVCSAKSLLLASLLGKTGLGYDVAIFDFEKARHSGVGIRIPDGKGSFGTSYCYIETVKNSPLGDVNKVEGQELDRKPTVISINPGGKAFEGISELRKSYENTRSKYGREYLNHPNELRPYLVKMAELKSELSQIGSKIDEINGDLKNENEKLNLEKERLDVLKNDFDKAQSPSLGNRLKPEEKNRIMQEYFDCHKRYSAHIDNYNLKAAEQRSLVGEHENLVERHNRTLEDYKKAFEEYSRK